MEKECTYEAYEQPANMEQLAGMLDLLVKKGCSANSHFAQPVTRGEFTYATNGFMIIRVSKIDRFTSNPPFDIHKVAITPEHAGEWIDIPEYKTPEKVKCTSCHGIGFCQECHECDGEGIVFWNTDKHRYEAECAECYGEGYIPGGDKKCPYCDNGFAYENDWLPINIHGEKINTAILDKIKGLPGIKIFIPSAEDIISFKFDYGDGAIMCMRD